MLRAGKSGCYYRQHSGARALGTPPNMCIRMCVCGEEQGKDANYISGDWSMEEDRWECTRFVKEQGRVGAA